MVFCVLLLHFLSALFCVQFCYLLIVYHDVICLWYNFGLGRVRFTPPPIKFNFNTMPLASRVFHALGTISGNGLRFPALSPISLRVRPSFRVFCLSLHLPFFPSSRTHTTEGTHSISRIKCRPMGHLCSWLSCNWQVLQWRRRNIMTSLSTPATSRPSSMSRPNTPSYVHSLCFPWVAGQLAES